MRKRIILFLVLIMVFSISVFAFAEKEITIKLIAGATGPQHETALKIASRYMKENPNVTIDVLKGPLSVQDRLAVYLQYLNAKSPEIDIYMIDVIWPGDLAEHLIDLNKYGLGEAAKDHFPRIVENNTVDGALVAIILQNRLIR